MKSKTNLLNTCLNLKDDYRRLWIIIASLFLEVLIDIRDIMAKDRNIDIPKEGINE